MSKNELDRYKKWEKDYGNMTDRELDEKKFDQWDNGVLLEANARKARYRERQLASNLQDDTPQKAVRRIPTAVGSLTAGPVSMKNVDLSDTAQYEFEKIMLNAEFRRQQLGASQIRDLKKCLSREQRAYFSQEIEFDPELNTLDLEEAVRVENVLAEHAVKSVDALPAYVNQELHGKSPDNYRQRVLEREENLKRAIIDKHSFYDCVYDHAEIEYPKYADDFHIGQLKRGVGEALGIDYIDYIKNKGLSNPSEGKGSGGSASKIYLPTEIKATPDSDKYNDFGG